MELQKNQVTELEITGYTAEGSGVGRAKGIPVFVPGAARGDRLSVRIVKTAKTYAFGRIEAILTPSPERVEPDCSLAAKCGGCVYRHLTYAEELRAKEERVADALRRIGGISFPVSPIVAAPDSGRYRNKAQLPLGMEDGRLVMGFYAPRSHRVIPCGDCLLQPESFTRAMAAFGAWAEETGESVYDEQTGKGRLRHLYLRCAMSTGDVMACVVVNGNGVEREDRLAELLREAVPELKSVVVNRNRERTNVILGQGCRTLWGEDALTDTLCGLQFSISPRSFYQVNRDGAERLYGLAKEAAALTGGETLLDLYCGTGTIGLSMAKEAGRVIGVEVVDAAVEDAKRNAARNGIQNAEFFCGDAAEAAERLEKEGVRPDVVVLDPPRKGCGEALVHTVARMKPLRVVYVSCDPATLARDLKTFAALGYGLSALTPVDMFPRTAHVECVALLAKTIQ